MIFSITYTAADGSIVNIAGMTNMTEVNLEADKIKAAKGKDLLVNMQWPNGSSVRYRYDDSEEFRLYGESPSQGLKDFMEDLNSKAT